mmetsp:Transcript_36833/g.97898  ORF Transcript_36833/g.97898 Transcript_36833/m.97898 type:complete len:701 (+) Transcript_36833:1172-3274(+)
MRVWQRCKIRALCGLGLQHSIGHWNAEFGVPGHRIHCNLDLPYCKICFVPVDVSPSPFLPFRLIFVSLRRSSVSYSARNAQCISFELSSLTFVLFQLTVFKKDFYNQTIKTDSGSTAQALVLSLGDDGFRLGVVTGDLVGVLAEGTVSLSIALKPAYDLVDTQRGVTDLQRMLVFFIYGTEIGTGGDLTSQIEVPTFATGFDVCPRGYIFSLDGANGQIGRTGSCSLCAAKLYSVSPLAGTSFGNPSCLNCPPSAVCEGGSDIEFSRGRWEIINGIYVLVGCPAGYQLVNTISGLFSHDAQDCSKCSATQYIVDSNNSAYTCQNCPLGARCDGSTLTSLVPDAVWVADNATGRYLLKTCPPGYERQVTTLDSQQCVRCLPSYFCTGGIASKEICPTDTFAPLGSTTASACKSAVLVELVVGLPMPKDQFGDNETEDFLEAVATVAKVDQAYVYVVQVSASNRRAGLPSEGLNTPARRGRGSRRALIGIQVSARVAVDSNSRAKEVAGLLVKNSLDAALESNNLPPVTALSSRAIVTENSSDSGNSFGAYFASLAGLLVVWFFYRRYRVQASYRVFLIAFRAAKAGDKATQRFTPFNLNKSYAAEMVLGRGAFGCVVKMRTIKGGQAVAIKLLIPERGASFEDREKRQLAREAAVLELMTNRKCEHAVHLAGVDAVLVRAEIAWFVLEYLHGDSLEVVNLI